MENSGPVHAENFTTLQPILSSITNCHSAITMFETYPRQDWKGCTQYHSKQNFPMAIFAVY
jgi:exo-beta-1,3-glucanase (GH17 family)